MGAVAMAHDEDIPLVRAKQLGLYDVLVDREAMTRAISDQPLSERAMLRHVDAPESQTFVEPVGIGDDVSGHARKAMNWEVQEVLETVFQQAKLICGWETAVCILFRIVSRERSYLRTAPDWMLTVFVEEKELLFRVFHNHNNDSRIEPGYSEDDDEDEEVER